MAERDLCRHCRCKVINRPRRLCFACHGDPAVRSLYPSKRVLTDAVVWDIIRDLGLMSSGAVAKKHGVSRQMVNYIDRGELRKPVLDRYEAEQNRMSEAELDAMIAEQLPTMPGLTEEEEDELHRTAPPPAVIARHLMARSCRSGRVRHGGRAA